ncbi:hypothetical protein ACVWZK_003054 [Bradyrhizobium sp. GM0.4]
MYGEQDTDPFFDGNDGNDYMDGGSGTDMLYGNNGDDMLLDGTDVDISFGQAGDDWFKVGDIAQALSTGPDEILGGDGVTDDGNKPGTIGFDIMDFSLQHARPVGVTYDLDMQANPLAAVNNAQSVPAAFEIEGLVGSSSNDTLGGDSGDNWVVGGSGADLLTGDAGNDVIVGGSIRLDTLIGRYESAPGVASTYDHNNNNDGSTEALRLQDARYQGASHRVAYDDTLGAGLLDNAALGTQAFDKHFTEMLRTQFFKDNVLGDGGADATTLATPDIALFTGRYADYRIDPISFQSANEGTVVAYKVTDLRDPNGVDANGVPIVTDGTDLVVGVELLRFSDRDVSLVNAAPILKLHAFDPGAAADNFASGTYAGGSNWTGSWGETGDNFAGATNGSATAGQIRVGSQQLQFTDNADGASVQRAVNLAGVQDAKLSFTYNQNSFDNGDFVRVLFTADATAATPVLHELGTITNAAGGGTHAFSADLLASLNIGETMTANAALRFEVVSSATNTGFSANNGTISVDNISVDYVRPAAAPSTDYVTTFTENGGAVAIANHPGIVDDGFQLVSAKAVLTGRVAGDALNANDIAGDGIASSVDNSVAGQITVNLTGPASLAAYQSAIQAITFSSNSNNPTNADRIVHVTVQRRPGEQQRGDHDHPRDADQRSAKRGRRPHLHQLHHRPVRGARFGLPRQRYRHGRSAAGDHGHRRDAELAGGDACRRRHQHH